MSGGRTLPLHKLQLSGRLCSDWNTTSQNFICSEYHLNVDFSADSPILQFGSTHLHVPALQVVFASVTSLESTYLHIYLQKLNTWLHFNIHQPQAVWYIFSQHLSSFRADTNGSFLPLCNHRKQVLSQVQLWSPANKIFPAANPALNKKEVIFVSLTRSPQRTALPLTSPQGLLIIGECRITFIKRRASKLIRASSRHKLLMDCL